MSVVPPNEGRVLNALAASFHWSKNLIIPRCCGLGSFERDLVIITPAGYLTEIEVKLTLSDWKRDAEKAEPSRWRSIDGRYQEVRGVSKFHDVEYGGRHKRFFYCVPHDLWLLAESRLTTDHLPAWAGVITFLQDEDGRIYHVRCAREATALNGRKMTADEINGLRETFYYRFWRHCTVAPETAAAMEVQ